MTSLDHLGRSGSPPLIVTQHGCDSGIPGQTCVDPCTILTLKLHPDLLGIYSYGCKLKIRGAYLAINVDIKACAKSVYWPSKQVVAQRLIYDLKWLNGQAHGGKRLTAKFAHCQRNTQSQALHDRSGGMQTCAISP